MFIGRNEIVTDIEKDIEVGLAILARKFNRFCYYPAGYFPIYVNTNEPLSSYYQSFPIMNHRVLTVTASGDHILQAVSMGAKEIDAFDKNRLAIYMSKLKIAALKVLTREEFINFFYYVVNPDTFFSIDLYEKIREYLDADTQLFWDTLYEKGDLVNTIINRFFVSNIIDDSYNSYQSEDMYYKTNEALDSVRINYRVVDLNNLPDVLVTGKRYGAMFLSNIYDHLKPDEVQKFPQVIEDLSKHLSDDGLIAVYIPPFDSAMSLGIEVYNGEPMPDFNREKVYVKSKL